jgi:hypothetical protein
MGCRANIFVTGDLPYADSRRQTVRLYAHWGGSPDRVLKDLRAAVKAANRLLTAFRTPRPQARAVTAQGFADCLRATSLTPNGFATVLDDRDGIDRPAVFAEAFDVVAHCANQADLEWAYVADVNARSVRVYGGFGAAGELIAQGEADPAGYAEDLLPQYRRRARCRIRGLVRSLRRLGWAVNGGPAAVTRAGAGRAAVRLGRAPEGAAERGAPAPSARRRGRTP